MKTTNIQTPDQTRTKSRYMGGPVDFAEAPNGAIVNAKAVDAYPRVWYTEPMAKEVVDGVWLVGGLSIANTVVIERDEGLIVYDGGDTRKEGEHLRAFIKENVSDKPIKILMYSHSHYALAGGAMVDDPEDVLVIGHPTLNKTVQSNLGGGGAPSAIPEIGPILTARALIQFSNLIPDEGPDASLQAKLELGKPVAFLPVTKTPEHGEVMELMGLKFQFFTEGVSDDHNLTVYIPEKGVVLNNLFFPGRPNVYSLRGGVYRDPLTWRDGLKMIRDLEPEVVLNTHAHTIQGTKDEVREVLTGYMDHLSVTYDQTLRGILHGLGPDDLRDFLYFPAHLDSMIENAVTYGESEHFPETIYQFAIGWYDRDVTKIFKVAPKEEAERLVGLLGGKAKVVEEARAAMNKEEFAWGAQLIQYVYLLDPMDKEVRQLKADILRQLGRRSLGTIPRNFLLTEARALEGKVTIPIMIPPQPGLVAGSPETFVDYFRVRIDPAKAENTDLVLGFVFTDKDDLSVGLHLRRGVVEFIPASADYFRKPDAVLRMDSTAWAGLYLSTLDLAGALASGEVTLAEGNRDEVVAAFEMFDKLDPAKNHTVPPLEA